MKKENSFYAVITACMGLAVFLEGQTVAMWIAMQGMASARTPISMLTGEACINAAVAWLGGGSVVSGGGGIVVGEIHLGRDSDYWCGDDGFSIGIYRLATDQE